MAISPQANTQAALDEVRKTRDTAARLANGDSSEDADHIRVLAGMIQKLAEQVERLAIGGTASVSTSGTARSAEAKDSEAAGEEDQTPEQAPADPRPVR
jgi:hypothetical protein